MRRYIAYLVVLTGLTACGGGPITINCIGANSCDVQADLTTHNDPGTVVASSGGASSPTPTPTSVPLAVPQTSIVPYVEVCDGCLQWSAGGIHYAVVFRDLPGTAEFAMIVNCGLANCTPGPDVWQVNDSLDGAIDLDFNGTTPGLLPLADRTNASLTPYARDHIFPKLVAWFAANKGNLQNNFKTKPTSTLPVPDGTDSLTEFARLTAIFNEHVLVGSDLVPTWVP